MSDSLGDRMKEQYENRTRYFLPRRTYTIVRVDGKAFHTFTKDCEKPFDDDLIKSMNKAAKYLCTMQGAEFAYVQSDEISVLLTDFADPLTQAYFNGNIQKLCSVSASMATACFNWSYRSTEAMFDSRVFTIPDRTEVENYFIWRQKDATKNSVQMVARSHYSHKELLGKNDSQLQDMIWQKGVNWNDYDPGKKRGRLVTKNGIEAPPIFIKDRDYLSKLIPRYE